MKKTDTYLIKWYGPFSSTDEVIKYEEGNLEIFNLYAFQAKMKREKSKYYCGMAYEQSVGRRMKNYNHHIHDFEDGKSKLHIWIGTIANVKAKESDVRICENLLTSALANKICVGEKNLENRTNKKPPVNNAYVINEWWKTNGDEIMKRTIGSIPAVLPEVLEYYAETKALYGAMRLKPLCDL